MTKTINYELFTHEIANTGFIFHTGG